MKEALAMLTPEERSRLPLSPGTQARINAGIAAPPVDDFGGVGAPPDNTGASTPPGYPKPTIHPGLPDGGLPIPFPGATGGPPGHMLNQPRVPGGLTPGEINRARIISHRKEQGKQESLLKDKKEKEAKNNIELARINDEIDNKKTLLGENKDRKTLNLPPLDQEKLKKEIKGLEERRKLMLQKPDPKAVTAKAEVAPTGEPPAASPQEGAPGGPASPLAGAKLGAKVLREQLSKLRAAKLPDDQILAGDDRGLFGQPGTMRKAMDDEQAALRDRAEVITSAAEQKADRIAVGQKAAELITQQNKDREEKLKTTIDERTKKIIGLRDGLEKTSIEYGLKGTGQKVMAAIALVLGGIGAGLTGGPNMALQVIENALKRDLDAQIARKRAKGEAIKSEQGILRSLRGQLGDLGEAKVLAMSLMWKKTQMDLQKMAVNQKGEEAQANFKIVDAQMTQKIAELEIKMREAARRRAVEDFAQETRKAVSESFAILAGDPAAQAQALISAGTLIDDPKMVEQGIAINTFAVKAAQGRGGAAGMMGTDKMIAAIWNDFLQTGEMSKRTQSTLNGLIASRSAIEQGVLAAMPQFDATEKIVADYNKYMQEAAGGKKGGAASPGNHALAQVKIDTDWNSLPSGTEYLDPEGKRRRKP